MYRLVIADDEKIECQALEHKIQNMLPDITLLPSVYDGYSLLKCVQEQQPDIAIVDINMPGLSGLEAIEILQMKNIRLKIIINSSYSDFSYAQQAIRLGASDYLLKPGSKDALADAIRKACQELDQENSNLTRSKKNEELVGSMYKVVSERWILSLIFDEEDRESFELLCSRHPYLREGGYMTTWQLQHAQEAFSMQKIQTEMQEFCSCVGAAYRDMYYLFLPMSADSPQASPEKVREMLFFVHDKFSAASISLSAGCSRYLASVSRYPDGIREAQAALHAMKHPGISLFQYGKATEKTALFPGLASQAAALLADGAQQDCVHLIHEALASKNSQIVSNTPEYLRVQAALFVVELVQLADERMKTRGQEFQQPMPWKILRQAERPSEIEEWISLCIHDCYVQLNQDVQKENQYVQKAMIFIRENYNQDISLEDIAGELGISPFYLSRLFTQSKDFTFIEMLTDVRIRAAIRMMRENTLSNREICERTGYTSITYFYRVFKKTTGLTVGEMRQYL